MAWARTACKLDRRRVLREPHRRRRRRLNARGGGVVPVAAVEGLIDRIARARWIIQTISLQ